MLQTIRAADGATSQKDGVEANVGRRSSEKLLTGHAVLIVSGFELALRSGIFTSLFALLDLHEMCP